MGEGIKHCDPSLDPLGCLVELAVVEYHGFCNDAVHRVQKWKRVSFGYKGIYVDIAISLAYIVETLLLYIIIKPPSVEQVPS